MTTASPLVALTIWTALLLYVAGEYGRARRPAGTWVRPVWLLGALVYLAHVAAAFGVHHDWSHAAAYACTAARTDALLGLDWGGGLWVNYAFTAIWVGEGLWWQLRPAHYAQRPRAWTTTVRGVFLFMIANGAVVFVSGPRRLLGIGVLAALVRIWRSEAGPRGPARRDRAPSTSDQAPLRAIIDTNLLVGALARRGGAAHRILKQWRAGTFKHVASEATLREAELVVGARWMTRLAGTSERDRLLAELRKRSILVEAPILKKLALKDAGDRRLVEAAHAGKARYLVTADREVLRMRGYGCAAFVTSGEFLRALSGRSAYRSPDEAEGPPSGGDAQMRR